MTLPGDRPPDPGAPGSGDRRRPDWAEEAVSRAARQGFLGPMPVVDQLEHALGFVQVVEEVWGGTPDRVLDLGSGGGLPGLVLAARWPGSEVVLLEANARRAEFLSGELGRGDVPRGTVVRLRAEEAGHDPLLRERFEVVTARSFGPAGVTAECGSPLVAVGGLLVVSEPPDQRAEDRWPADGLAALSLEVGPRIRVAARFGYQVLTKVAQVPDRFPRRTGIPRRRPLFQR